MRPARRAVSALFLVQGLTGGAWMARVPAAKSQVHLSDGTLGIALFSVPVGLVIGAFLAERLVDRIGSARLARISGLGLCAVTMTPGFASALPELMAALFGIGAFAGVFDVTSNAQGVRVESAYGRPVLTSMHAFYSLGAIGGSLAAAAFAAGDITLLPSLAAVGGAGALVVTWSGPWLLPEDRDAALAGQAGAAGTGDAGEEAARAVPESGREAARRVRRLVIALGVLGVCALVGEGSAGDWSAVYLRDSLGTSAAVAALAFSAFSATMTLGRGVGDQFIHRFGVVPVIRACGLIATAGLGLALATAVPVVAVAGFTAFGLGLSAVVPQVFAAGGRADPVRPGSGLAKVVGFGYVGMAAGPAIIGLVAGRTGLHLALLIPLALTAWIFVAAPVLARAGRGGPRIRSG
jgi:fucose permease